MAKHVFLGAIIVRLVAFLTMAGVTYVWFTVPDRIVLRESSPTPAGDYSVELKEHGRSYFVTPAQKRTLDRIDSFTTMVWFGGLAVSVLSVFVAASARLKMTERDAIKVAIGKL